MRMVKLLVGNVTPVSFVESMIGYSLATFERVTGLQLSKEPHCCPIGLQGLRVEFSWHQNGEPPDWMHVCQQLASPRCLALYACNAAMAGTSPEAYSCPETLLHLVATNATPSICRAVFSTILRLGRKELSVHNWEVNTQMSVLSDNNSTGENVICLKYAGKPNVRMLMSPGSPLIIAVSRQRLTEDVPISLNNDVEQLLSMFAWDSEMAIAYFMLANEIRDSHQSHFISMLQMEPSGMFVVSGAERLGDLAASAVTAPISWRSSAHTTTAAGCGIVDEAKLQESLDQLGRCASCGQIGPCRSCARCQTEQYCSKSCQVSDWTRGHRTVCVPWKSS
jgi:MYND finger